MKCCCFTLYRVIFADVLFFFFSPFSPKCGHADFLPPSFPTMSPCEYVSAELVTFTEICKVDWKMHGCISGCTKSGGNERLFGKKTHLCSCKLRQCITAHMGEMRSLVGLAKREISDSHSHRLNLRRSLIVSHLDASFLNTFVKTRPLSSPPTSSAFFFLKREEE